MTPEDLLLIVMLAALSLYAVLGGADFGAGIWEFTTALQASDRERKHVYKAIGPVWEANHVWLIFIVVILLNAFPPAFALLSRTLWLPVLLALCGIVFRGASYVFWSYGMGTEREQTAWEVVFAIASTAAPFFLGAGAGAIASGKLTQAAAHSDITHWMSPLSMFTGFYAVALCGYLAAVYLAREAQGVDEHLHQIWRQRALSTGLWVGVLSLAGLFVVRLETPALARELLSRGSPLVFLSLVCGIDSLVATWRNRTTEASLAAMGAVAAVIWGWGIAQYPAIIAPDVLASAVKAPDQVLWLMIAVIATGAAVLFPSLAYLFVLFKTHR